MLKAVKVSAKKNKITLYKNSRCEELLGGTLAGLLPPPSCVPRGRRAVYSCNAQTGRVTFRDFTRTRRRLCRRCRASPARSTAALSLRGSPHRRPTKTERETTSHFASRRVASGLVASFSRSRAMTTNSGVFSLLCYSPNAAISRTTPYLSARVTRYMYTPGNPITAAVECERVSSNVYYSNDIRVCVRFHTNVVTRIDGMK